MIDNGNSNVGMERLVVLGHTGFVGGRLVEHFGQRYPGLEVIGLSSREIDLTQTEAATQLREFLGPNTGVIMCSGIKSNFGSNLETYGRNLSMARNVCHAISETKIRRFLFFSSIAVYGVDRHDVGITEETPIVADTFYGLAKHHSEELLSLTFEQMEESDLIILRTPTVYGPNEKIIAPTPSGFLTTFMDDGQVSVWGDGGELREFLFVDDLLQVVDGLFNERYSGILNVSSGSGQSYQDALDIICGLLGKTLPVIRRERTKEKVDKVYNTALLQQLLPDLRFTSLADGLQKIFDEQRLRLGLR